MALNIKDKETETLVSEIASMTGETKTGAMRQAARERLERLRLRQQPKGVRHDAESMRLFFEAEIWPLFPEDMLDREPMSKAEREDILGYGPDGV